MFLGIDELSSVNKHFPEINIIGYLSNFYPLG